MVLEVQSQPSKVRAEAHPLLRRLVQLGWKNQGRTWENYGIRVEYEWHVGGLEHLDYLSIYVHFIYGIINPSH